MTKDNLETNELTQTGVTEKKTVEQTQTGVRQKFAQTQTGEMETRIVEMTQTSEHLKNELCDVLPLATLDQCLSIQQSLHTFPTSYFQQPFFLQVRSEALTSHILPACLTAH